MTQIAAPTPKIGWFERHFKVKERGSSIGTEIRAGSTTFMTMAYILPVQAGIMAACGMPFGAVLTMTALLSGIFCICGGFRANYPFAVAPGMGTNAIFAFSIVNAGIASWQAAMGMMFIAGMCTVLFQIRILKFTKLLGAPESVYNFSLREKFVRSIPEGLQTGFAAAIGSFLLALGLGGNGIGIVPVLTNAAKNIGDILQPGLLIGFAGLILCAILFWGHGVRKTKNRSISINIRGGILISMLVITAVLMLVGIVPLPQSLVAFPNDLGEIAFKLDIAGALRPELLPFILVLFMGDIFSTTGTALVCVNKSGINRDGKFKDWDKLFFWDAVAAPTGAVVGLTTPTYYIESIAGVADGGRTGITSITTGLLFLVALFLSPIFGVIPPIATGIALVIIGVEMFRSLLPDPDNHDTLTAQRELTRPEIFLPLVLMVALTLLTFDFASSMCWGLIVWVLMTAYRRFILLEKDLLPTVGSKIMAVVVFALSVLKIIYTI